ncbi:MAG: hypothetical protein D8B49_01015 [Riemerella sp.]|jgi:hypothetical protein|nr:MAG: hypothetical protein D8B49_01015 [Riemerella sp.]DAW55603.1 MAG TPA: hypothetical protein [Caudoviricetes sp.]DAX96979.1 MAG TPA: hypothetical protein [Caudoviricetes sp.]
MLSNITFKNNLKMDKIEEITEAVKEFFERETKELSKEEYQEVLRELISDFAIMLDASKRED